MSLEEYAAVGAQFRNTRLKLGISLADIAAYLHIRAQYLQALEEGRPDALPGLPYARGYIQRYAEFLKLEPAPLIDAFERAGIFPQKRFFQFPEMLNRAQEPSDLLVKATFAGALLLVVFWIIATPKPPVPIVLMPFPVSQEIIDKVPDACKIAVSPAYPPCYWKGEKLDYPPLWMKPE